MRKIRLIAKAELNNLFYSPIAWILLILFLVQCGLAFADNMVNYAQMVKYMKLFKQSVNPATFSIMADPQSNGFFPAILSKLYLYLPLLTMGLISRELSSGTIRLLYSSPVKTLQIVLGKFLAMVAYTLLLVAITTVFACVAGMIIPQADTGILFSGVLAFFLVLCMYSAIGLFMSTLTSYQVVAALSTLAVFAVLNYIGSIGQGIDWVRDITYYLSFGTRTDTMFKGLLTSRDILYFVIITALFLAFSFFKLIAAQRSQSAGKKVMQYAGASAVAIFLVYLSSQPGLMCYADVTEPKSNSIAPVTQALLRSTGQEPLEVTAYVNLLDLNYSLCSPQNRNKNYLSYWEKYIRYKPGLKFNYVYYYASNDYISQTMRMLYKDKTVKQVAEEFAETNDISLNKFLPPSAAEKIPEVRSENAQIVMKLTYKGRSSMLRMFQDQERWPSESQVATALKNVMQPGISPKVGYMSGNLQRELSETSRGDRQYSLITTAKSVRQALVNNGYELVELNENAAIPPDISVLVIADPKTAYSPEQQQRLQQYIDRGGNLLVTSEPGKQEVINPILQPLGIRMLKGLLVQKPQGGDLPDLLSAVIPEAAADLNQSLAILYNGNYPVYLPGAAALEMDSSVQTGFQPKALLMTPGNDHSWIKMGHFVGDSADVEFNAADGDVQASAFTTVMGAERQLHGKTQRVAVAGDADFMDNQNIQSRRPNLYFVAGLLKWLSNGQIPVDLSRADFKDQQAPETQKVDTSKLLSTWILPALLLLLGAAILIRRKRS